jgi:hypothetical protein
VRRDVLRAYAELECSSEFNRLNFERIDFIDKTAKRETTAIPRRSPKSGITKDQPSRWHFQNGARRWPRCLS